MRKGEKASISTIKIICISLVLIICSGIGVMAANTKVSNVKIVFANNNELNVLTAKTKVADILKDNNIVLLEKEITSPLLEDNVGEDKVIKITNTEHFVSKEISESISWEEIKGTYSTVVEQIETLQVEIPYETIIEDVSGDESQDKTTKVIQEGENGLKEITYKITIKDGIEVDRLELETKIIKEPVNKQVKLSKKVTTSRGGGDRTANANIAINSTSSLAKQVENITPKEVTLNASAYTASTCGKSSTEGGYGYTASGAKAQPWYTVAAGKGYKMGTIMYIPYFKDMPNGGWFVVQDRGSAITNSKVDVYMSTYGECKQFGRRNLTCYIYEI